ncbi:ACT domain-containing protein [Candidatus Acetothermia bacterium]|nr:ACT domain-containing protein [Candidatus Acetothermia bacterium]
MQEFRISLPNQPGQLARVAEALGKQGVNIRTVAAIGAANPVIALVTELEDKTKSTLQGLGLSFEEVETLTVRIPDQPGELGKVATKLSEAMVNIDSIYMLNKSGEVEIALTVSNVAKAKQALGL